MKLHRIAMLIYKLKTWFILNVIITIIVARMYVHQSEQRCMLLVYNFSDDFYIEMVYALIKNLNIYLAVFLVSKIKLIMSHMRFSA